MTSYSQSYYSVTSTYRQLFLSQLAADDYYLIFATENQYVMISSATAPNVNGDSYEFQDATVYTLSRNLSSGSQNILSRSETDAASAAISYDIYCYSNVGVGTFEVIPQLEITAYRSQLLMPGLISALILSVLAATVFRQKWRFNND